MTVSTSYWPANTARFVLKLPTAEEPGDLFFQTAEGEQIDVSMAVWGKVKIEIDSLASGDLQGSPPSAWLPILLEIRT